MRRNQRERSRIGRTDQRLSRNHVLDAALNLVDHEGITGLSMRKLGAALGIEAMTLYYYFPNKDAILDSLVERVALQALTVPIGQLAAWPEWLRALAVGFHSVLLQHPRLVPLIATRPVQTPDALRAVEQIAAALCDAGFSPLRAFRVINTVTTFVIGHTLAEAGDIPGHEAAVPDSASLADRLDPAAFPCFSAALLDGLGQPHDHQARFDFALDALFIGLALQFTEEHGR